MKLARATLLSIIVMSFSVLFFACGGDGSSSDDGDGVTDPHESPAAIAEAMYELYRSGDKVTCSSDLFFPQDALEELFSDHEAYCSQIMCDSDDFLYTLLAGDDVLSFDRWKPKQECFVSDKDGNELPCREGSGVYATESNASAEFQIHKVVEYNGKWYILELMRDRNEVCM